MTFRSMAVEGTGKSLWDLSDESESNPCAEPGWSDWAAGLDLADESGFGVLSGLAGLRALAAVSGCAVEARFDAGFCLAADSEFGADGAFGGEPEFAAESESTESGFAGDSGLDVGLGPAGLGSGAGSPPIDTGVAAPRFVAGAIAAIWLAYRIYVPALAARAPGGDTYVATGTVDARIERMMSRIAPSRPPGVSISRMTRGAPAFCADSIPRTT